MDDISSMSLFATGEEPKAKRPESASGGEAARLDLLPNNVISSPLKGTGRLMVKPHRCRCRTCQQCGPMYGRSVRARLLELAPGFKNPMMFTLTLEHSRFDEDPRAAYLEITSKRYISRLLKELGIKRWVWVLEFQKSGWPHWHLLIDAPGGRVDLKRAWELWGWNRDGWKLGGLDLGKSQVRGGRDAVRYITKYLVKYPEHAFPEWLLDLKRKVRWVQASRAVGRVVTDREPTVKDVQEQVNAEEAAESLPVEHRTLRQRMKTCGGCVEFLRELINPTTGEITYRFAGRLDAAFFQIVEQGGAIHIDVEESGRRFIPDLGDVRVMMSNLIGKTFREGGGPSAHRQREQFETWREEKPFGEQVNRD